MLQITSRGEIILTAKIKDFLTLSARESLRGGKATLTDGAEQQSECSGEQLSVVGVSPIEELKEPQRLMKPEQRNWWDEDVAKSIGEGVRRGLAVEVREPLPSAMEEALRLLRRQDDFASGRRVTAAR